MNKTANFLVKRRFITAVLTLLITAFCGILIPKVNINYDMSKYLPESSSMKQGMELMDSEFPDSESVYTVRAMFNNLDESERDGMLKRLEALEYVDSVDYDAESSDYNSGTYTLFILNTSYDYSTDEEKSIENTLENDFDGYELQYKNGDSNYTGLPFWILLVAVAMALAVLFIMCGSWFEPLLYIVTIGAAVVINLGSNVMFESVSNTTFSIAAILQMILSIDYSVILMNRYKQERKLIDDTSESMKKAICNSFSSVSGSSLTTIVGLLALVFMSFSIGRDLGLVLAKGVLCSLICNYTLLPCLMIASDRLIAKTAKKQLNIKTGALASYSFRFRRVITVVFVLLFAASCVTQSFTGISYSISEDDPIGEIFPVTETTVLLYENSDEAPIEEVAASIEQDPAVKSVTTVAPLVAQYNAEDIAAMFGELGGDKVDVSLINLLLYDMKTGGELPSLTLSEFISFIQNDVAGSDTFSSYMSGDYSAQLAAAAKYTDTDYLTTPLGMEAIASDFGGGEQTGQLMLLYFTTYGGVDTGTMTLAEFIAFVSDESMSAYFDASALQNPALAQMMGDSALMNTEFTSAELSAMLGIDSAQLDSLYLMYALQTGATSDWMITPAEFIRFMAEDIAADPVYSNLIDAQTMQSLSTANTIVKGALAGTKYTASELYALAGGMIDEVDEGSFELLLMYYGSVYNGDTSWTASPEEFVDFLRSDVLKDERFSALTDGSLTDSVTKADDMLKDSVAQLQGENHSRMIITTAFTGGEEESNAFFKELEAECGDKLSGSYYLIGDSAMSYEMGQTFGTELIFITLLTALAVFIVVAVTFRSFIVPLLIVLLIQCGVYITVTIAGLTSGSIYYLALLVVECILMGATIDYAILFTNYYKENRRTLDIKEAVAAAYNGSIHTVMTSGMIVVIVAFLVGYCFKEPTVAQICRTLSLGAATALLLIIFVLPGVIAAVDKAVMRKKK